MKKIEIKYIAFFAAMIFIVSFAKGQIPVNDPAWQLDTSLSDEFNSGSINTAKWDTSYYFWYNGGFSNVSNGAEWDYSRNLIMTDTTLKIKADTLSPNHYRAWGTFPDYGYGTYGSGLTYAYQGGVIHSKSPNKYKFGYVEIYAKFPSKKYPLWPALWLWSANCPSKFYNEIDFAENNAEQSYAGNRIGNNYHVADTSCYYQYGLNGAGDITLAVDSLSGGFHKFAIQWDPHRMIYYFDDVPTTSIYNSNGTGIPQNAMTLILNFCVDPWYAFLPSDWTRIIYAPHKPTFWPQYLEINYCRYYKLNTDCNTDLNICTPGTDYNHRAVEKSITTGSGCSPVFNTSNSYTLRATDYVILDAGTTINADGSGFFAIDITACPQ
jgi:beta-glucanase (GH16 family)